MSNRRKLCQPLNGATRGGSGLHRPFWTWRGYRPPRSARKRWEQWMAAERMRDQLLKSQFTLRGLDEAIEADAASKSASKLVHDQFGMVMGEYEAAEFLKLQPKPSEAVIAWAEAHGIDITDWQAALIEEVMDKEGEPADA